MSQIVVTLNENGSYSMRGDFVIALPERTEPRQQALLCRCGASKTKPFCDASHVTTGFESSGETYTAAKRRYKGKAIAVMFDYSLCAHMAVCLRGAPEVFNVRKRPWILTDAADAERVADVVSRCPTGALTYARLDGGKAEEPVSPATVTPVPNGPYQLHGQIEICTADGTTIYEGTRAALCRCGASRSKPFCDNSHRMIGFEAP